MKIIKLIPIAALLLIYSCGGKTEAEKQVADETPLVKAVEAVTKDVPQNFEFTGNIEAYIKNMISSQGAMRIDKILVEVGDHVRKGQTVVKMEGANLLQAKLQLEHLKTEYGRVQSLYSTGGVSKQQLDQMKTQLDVAQESYNNLNENITLTSPIDGVITMKMFNNGDVTGGQPILQVQQLKPVKVLINVSEELFPQTKVGMPIDVKLDIYQDEIFKGKISLIYPTIDPVTHTFTVEVKLDNQDMRVRPGMFARATLNFGTKNHIVIPDKSIIKQQGTNDRYVFILNKDNTVAYKKVILGQRLENLYEVLSGINANEQVVTDGISRLVDGKKVRLN